MEPNEAVNQEPLRPSEKRKVEQYFDQNRLNSQTVLAELNYKKQTDLDVQHDFALRKHSMQ